VNDKLPQGWVELSLGDDSDFKKGKKPKDLYDQPQEMLLPYIDIKAFEKGIYRKYSAADGGVRAEENDCLMVWDGARSGLVGRSVAGIIGSTLMRIKPIASSPEFFYYFLKSQFPFINGNTKGTGIPHVDPAKLWSIQYPFPPLNEQIRIANKLDSLLTKVYAAQTRLEKIPTLLKRFRQSVLAAATSGELTREWRSNTDMSWPRVILKDVATGFNYGSSTKSQTEGQVPVLRMGNLQSGKLDWSKLVYTSDKDEIEKYFLEPGDVLFNRTNSPELVGKTSIYRGEQKSIFAGYLIRIKGTEKLNSEYLNIQLNSPDAKDYCWKVKTDGVSQSNINAKKIQAYEFELPSMDEQKEIVRRVESLFSLADSVEKQYTEAKKRTDRLTQSLLAKAFRGELVPQDPNDEPASVMLERIQQEKALQPRQKNSNLRKPKKKLNVTSKKSSAIPKQDSCEVFSIIQAAESELSAQQIMDKLSDELFETVDLLFLELKRLLDSDSIERLGIGESIKFRVINK